MTMNQLKLMRQNKIYDTMMNSFEWGFYLIPAKSRLNKNCLIRIGTIRNQLDALYIA